MCNHRRYSRPCRCTCSCRQCSRTWHACRTYDYYSRTRSVRRSWTCRFYSNREDTRTYKSRSRWRTSCSRCSGDRPIHLAACTHPHLMMIRKKGNIDCVIESSYKLSIYRAKTGLVEGYQKYDKAQYDTCDCKVSRKCYFTLIAKYHYYYHSWIEI